MNEGQANTTSSPENKKVNETVPVSPNNKEQNKTKPVAPEEKPDEIKELEKLEEYHKKKIAELEKDGDDQLTEEQKKERTKRITSEIVAGIESGKLQNDKDVEDTLDNLPQSVAQVEQNQAALDQLHEEVLEANMKLSNSSEEDIATE